MLGRRQSARLPHSLTGRPPVWTSYCPLFFFNDTATTEIYTLSLHDALPISIATARSGSVSTGSAASESCANASPSDRKSTRLNSSHMSISYAVFCLKKKTDVRDHPHLLPTTVASSAILEDPHTARVHEEVAP